MGAPTTDGPLIERLAAAFAYVIVDPEVLANWSRDWWSFTAKLADDAALLPAAAVVVETVDDVVTVIRIATEFDRPVVIRGGGSNLVGALEPMPGAIVLDLRGLNVIDPVNELDGTVRADAGVLGGELEARLNEAGYSLGHYPDSLHYSTVGGWIAMGAVGSFSTGYGGIERMVEGIEVVLADGSIVRETPPRHGLGPRLAALFIGAEGAFGVVTAATLRVWPLPEDRRFAAWRLPAFDDALPMLAGLLHRGIAPAMLRLYDPAATTEVAESFGVAPTGSLLLAACDGPESVVELELRLLDDVFTAAGGVALGEGPALAWFGARYAADWWLDPNEQEGWLADRIDIAAHWSRLAALHAAVLDALAPHADSASVLATHFTHSGGMLAVTFTVRAESDEVALARYQTAWIAVMRATLDAGGSIAHHQGIGQARLPWLAETLGSGAVLLRSLKHALDPQDRFNPGRLAP